MGGVQLQGISRMGAHGVSQVDGISDIAPACQLSGCVGEGSERPLLVFQSGRKLSPSFFLDTRHFSSSPYATGAFQGATPLPELRGSASE